MSKATFILSVVLATVISFAMGSYTGYLFSPKTTVEANGEYTSLAQLSKALKPGESAVISIDEARTGPIERRVGRMITNDKALTTFLSPIGMQAVEGISRDQGIEGVKKGGLEVEQVAENKGSGILENLWYTARGWIVVGLIVLAVVFIILPILAAVIPALGPAVGAITSTFGTVLASCIPVLGGIIAWVQKNILHTAVGQVITGGDNFKAKIKQTVFVEDAVKNSEIITKVLDIFATEMNASQDTTAKSLVNSFQKKQ